LWKQTGRGAGGTDPASSSEGLDEPGLTTNEIWDKLSLRKQIRRIKMKTVHGAMYSALLMLFCSALSQAQHGSASAQTSNFNTASPAASNVTGTGTKDYVPLWLSKTGLGSSIMFQS
jgi:hypothetical protein